MRQVVHRRQPPPLQVAVVDGRLPATSVVEQSFAEFYARACPEAVAHASWFVSRDEAWDAVQEAALEVFSKWAELTPVRKTVGYFIRSVHFRVLDELRRSARHDTRHVDLGDVPEAELTCPPHSGSAPFVSESGLDVELLQRVVARLDGRVREAWVLCHECGMHRDEIADVMNVSPVTVRRHLMRATELIRQELVRGGERLAPATTPTLPAAGMEVVNE